MKFLSDFLHQKAPRPGTDMPAYYRNALTFCDWTYAVYFALCFALLGWRIGRWEVMPAAMFAVTAVMLLNVRRTGMRLNLLVHTACTVAWCYWFVRMFGWNCGALYLLMPLVVLIFFAIYEPPWLKLFLFLGLVFYRMLMYTYSLDHPPVCVLDQTTTILLQGLNSLTTFVILACICIMFSSNTQATERQLRLDNQSLLHKADTDPLTMLPNRRAMLEEINQFLEKSPNDPFCVAIGDIDFFKKINDTYGHNCGDYTLKTLAGLFRATAEGKYSVCRWGGEEFCFFMPGKNLDEAAQEMFVLCSAVRHMPLNYEEYSFNITITIGVAENDFRSPMQAILDEADKKLYLGKSSGRDQVVV